MRGAVRPITERETAGKWGKLLPQLGVSKVGLYEKESSAFNDNYLHTLVSDFDYVDQQGRPIDMVFDLSYVTYLGFGVRPIGLLFRDAGVAKDFRIVDFGIKKLAFYVSQQFEEQLSEFRYGMPIILLEGVLDVESFAHLIEYPYVMGYLTSYVPAILAAFIASMTNRIGILNDNDQSGRENVHRSVDNFKMFEVVPAVHQTALKDFGDVYSLRDDLDVARAKAFMAQFC